MLIYFRVLEIKHICEDIIFVSRHLWQILTPQKEKDFRHLISLSWNIIFQPNIHLLIHSFTQLMVNFVSIYYMLQTVQW